MSLTHVDSGSTLTPRSPGAQAGGDRTPPYTDLVATREHDSEHRGPGLQTVIDNGNTIVASEGGSLEVVELSDSRHTVKYTPGVNDECPECVPDHDLVRVLMLGSISAYAPHVKQVEVQ
jgi:hypothetical protein